MKLNPISEELEWRLFEWVEGNLTPEETAELEIIISQDANLQAHVAALKATQLGNEFSEMLDDQTKFSLKHYSIKPASVTNTETQSFKWTGKIAAAIVVLIVSTMIYQKNQPKTNGNLAQLSNPSPENKKNQNLNSIQPSTGETTHSTTAKTLEHLVIHPSDRAKFKQAASANYNNTTVEHPLIIATTLPNISKSIISENFGLPQISQVNKTIIKEVIAPKIEEETIVMMSPTAKSNPKEFAKMAWGNMKEMMRQGKLPKIIISPVKTEEYQRIPDVNFGIQMNQMSFVKTVSYNPTHN